ncbi:SPOR domain-containing protein [Caldimonas brevitalea]|uniref:SPOR domain-containing protein n=1 Tax=Caldimonas brevitalea TaxID=413882 RepID=A0A0G3BGC6_9BURK|nr:SPOR domain-containing protein [Caldimonas brevitalea]AKJ27023.1 hypothetical protein AAW51_0332 [Caldimonas brevitalea]
MLRLLVLLLLIANLGFYAWRGGHLAAVAGAPADEREPERLREQVRPEAIRLPAAKPERRGAVAAPADASLQTVAAHPPEVSGTAAPTGPLPAAGRCVEAGPYTETEMARVKTVLDAELPAGEWSPQRREKPGVFLVYIGRFPSREALQQRQSELRALGLASEELRSSPGFEPGLSLGRYTDKREADARLGEVAAKGLRTARVVTITPSIASYFVRLRDGGDALQARLRNRLKGTAPARAFTECRADAAPPA